MGIAGRKTGCKEILLQICYMVLLCRILGLFCSTTPRRRSNHFIIIIPRSFTPFAELQTSVTLRGRSYYFINMGDTDVLE